MSSLPELNRPPPYLVDYQGYSQDSDAVVDLTILITSYLKPLFHNLSIVGQLSCQIQVGCYLRARVFDLKKADRFLFASAPITKSAKRLDGCLRKRFGRN